MAGCGVIGHLLQHGNEYFLGTARQCGHLLTDKQIEEGAYVIEATNVADGASEI